MVSHSLKRVALLKGLNRSIRLTISRIEAIWSLQKNAYFTFTHFSLSCRHETPIDFGDLSQSRCVWYSRQDIIMRVCNKSMYIIGQSVNLTCSLILVLWQGCDLVELFHLNGGTSSFFFSKLICSLDILFHSFLCHFGEHFSWNALSATMPVSFLQTCRCFPCWNR